MESELEIFGSASRVSGARGRGGASRRTRIFPWGSRDRSPGRPRCSATSGQLAVVLLHGFMSIIPG